MRAAKTVLFELAVETLEIFVDCDEDLATGYGDGVLGTLEQEVQQVLTKMKLSQLFSQEGGTSLIRSIMSGQ